MKKVFALLLAGLTGFWFASGQEAWDNSTRALYILDIAKYIQYDNEIQSLPDFKIAVLGTNADFIMELYEMAKTRQFIQQKPIKVYQYPDLDYIEKCHILFVHINEGFDLSQVFKRTKGNNTLVISEGYPFNESMLNFIVVNGQPEFEVNEERMNEEGLYVDELFLAHAIKTREDWEELFKITEVALEEEKEVVREQQVTIDSQKIEIVRQEQQIIEQQELLNHLNEEIELKQQTIAEKTMVLDSQVKEISQQRSTIEVQQEEVESQLLRLQQQTREIEQKQSTIQQQETRITDQETRIVEQTTVLTEQLKALEMQKMLIIFFIIALILVSGLGYFIYRGYRIKKQANILLEAKNVQISRQKDEIQRQKEIAEAQRDQIAYQKKHITDSIEYALRIQTALLPSLELFTDKLDHFVFYKPRDIVSGDFYWVAEVDSKQVIIAADCTGHGVPGAFMSMLGVSFLNEIILNKGIHQPDQVLNALRDEVITSLKQDEDASDVKDGMDMCVCLLDSGKESLQFAGANNPLWIFSRGELTEIKGDKMPVAIHEKMSPFTNHWIDLKKGDTFYIHSDGFADQFGGPNQKKFLSKNFKTLLSGMQDKPMLDQGAELDRIFEEWRKDIEQIDDVTVIGVRF